MYYWNILVILYVVLIIGWILNIVKLSSCSFNPFTSETVIRIIGVFTGPVGSVLGFMGHW